MSFERKIGLWKERLIIEWRAMGRTKYLPFIVNYVLTPLGLLVYKRLKEEFYLEYLEDQIVFFVPLVSVWWSLLIMQQYVEGDGREILHIRGKGMAADVAAFYGIYIISLIPIFSYVMASMPRAFIVIPVLLLKSFMFVGIFYMVSVLMGSVSYGFIIVFVLSLFMENRLGTVLRMFGLGLADSAAGYGLTGLICMAAGIFSEKLFEKRFR